LTFLLKLAYLLCSVVKDPLSLARLVAGAAKGLPFSNPDSLQAIGKLSSTNVDEWTIANLSFSNNEIGAQLFTGIFADSDCTVEVIGSEGTVRLGSPWRPDVPEMGSPTIVLTKSDEAPTTIEKYDSLGTSIFVFEAEEASNAILAGQKECRSMTWEDSIGQVKAMDEWRRQIDLKYQAD
jgi:predicted dehydrogenase